MTPIATLVFTAVLAAAPGGRLARGPLPANAGRNVLVYVPEGFIHTEPATLVIYLHGLRASLDRMLAADGDGVMARIAALGALGNAVYVVPEGVLASGRPWPEAGMSFAALEEQALTVAAHLSGGDIAVARRTLVAHSAGGKAVALAAARDDLRADKLVLLDCFYGAWAQAIAAWAARAGALDVEYYQSSDVPNDERRVARFFAALSRLPGVHAVRHEHAARHAELPRRYVAP